MEKNSRGVRKGTWTKEEDCLLKECIEKYGEGKWHLVPLRAGLNRCRKSCRLRWLNYLRPNIKRSCFTKDEVDLMMRLHKLLGNKWSLIAGRLPGRTANDVKNFWNTHIEKKQLAAATIGRGGWQRGKVRKAITQGNIVRPRPRTFSKPVHVPWPKDNNNNNINSERKKGECSNTWTREQDKMENKQRAEAPSSSSTSQEEADECIRWWSNLLETTENGGLPNLFSEEEVEEEDHQKKHVSGDCDNSNIPKFDADGWGNLSLNDDGDVWELVNLL